MSLKIKLVKCLNDHLLSQDPIGLKFIKGQIYDLEEEVASRVMGAHPGCFHVLADEVPQKQATDAPSNKMAQQSTKEK